MLIINPQPYRGRFHAKASAMVRNRQRVGMMRVSGEATLHCHACEKHFPCPAIDPVHKDAWGECPHCKLPFVFIQVP